MYESPCSFTKEIGAGIRILRINLGILEPIDINEADLLRFIVLNIVLESKCFNPSRKKLINERLVPKTVFLVKPLTFRKKGKIL